MNLKSLTLALLIGLTCHAQLWPGTRVRENLDYLIASIHQYEPALDEYAPYFDKEASKIMSELQPECTAFEYFTYVSRICALAKEGHFGVGNWSGTIHRGIPQNAYAYLPVEVKIIDGRIFVWEDISNEAVLHRGDEILSINGRSVRQIIETLYACTPSDGAIYSYLERTIEMVFPWLYYFHIEQPKTFEVAYRAAGEMATLSALTREQQVENFKERNKSKAKPEDEPFAFDIDGNKAYWYLPAFARGKAESMGIKAKKEYKANFKEMQERGVEILVIDLRGNMGGLHEFADEMVPYILQNDPDETWLKASESWEGKTKKHKLPKASKYLFTGQIYVLVNGRTFSNGSTLTRYLKEYGDAIVIGEETGSCYEGYAAGSKQFITLPHSKMSIGIPRYHISHPSAVKQATSDRGVIPTHIVKPSIEDLMEDRDVAVLLLMQLLDKQD